MSVQVTNRIRRVTNKIRHNIGVHVVNVVSWLEDNFRESDYVFIKMDVECAEHDIVASLLETGAGRLIDRVVWECHAGCSRRPSCRVTEKRLRDATAAQITAEGSSGYSGYDSFSPPKVHHPEC